MVDKRLIERIHDDLEGRLKPEERNRLQEQLAADKEAAGYYDDWKKIQNHLERNRDVVPDIHLAQEVIRQITFAANSKSKSEPMVQSPFWHRQYVRYSFVFVAGVLIGFLVFALLMPATTTDFSPKEQMTGTLFDSRSFDQMKVADNLLFETVDIRATFEIRYSSGLVEARIGVNSGEGIQCTLDFDPNDLQPLNVTSTNFTEESTFTASSNWVKISSTGDNQFVVRLLNKNSLPHLIRIRLIRNDMAVYQNTVTVNKE